MKSDQKRRAIQIINAIKTRGSTVSLDAVANLLNELIWSDEAPAAQPHQSERPLDMVNAAEKITRSLTEKFAEDRAYRIATRAAEEIIRCEGHNTDTADEFLFTGEILADEHFQDCVAHLKWVGECVTTTIDGESLIVLLGDFSMGESS